jgi:DNA helicase HerA-like ATPase
MISPDSSAEIPQTPVSAAANGAEPGIAILRVPDQPGRDVCLLAAFANRHGLITGATGTGKTVTLQRMAERLSRIGVAVFMADVKGDLTGLAAPGTESPKLLERCKQLGVPSPRLVGNPVALWDVFGTRGHPLRATISDMGPLLLARMMGLNDVQSGVLQLVFRVADDNGLLLLDSKDLRAMLAHVAEHADALRTEYGQVSSTSVGAIQRALLNLDEQGADVFFGEPMLDLNDLLTQDERGRGFIHILAADRLMQAPQLYGTFLLWLMAELFEQLPEVGDLEQPRLVFFFDEAHLLFEGASPALVNKIEQVVRLIRSKGVGIYFVTQNPLDIPESVLGQLGNRVQHALRAFTPRDQKAVRVAAQTLRPNPAFDALTAITELGVGEALVSFLDAEGRPMPVERGFVLPPGSRIGPLTEAQRAQTIAASPLAGKYEAAVDRESAYERLRRPAQSAAGRASASRNRAAADSAAGAALQPPVLNTPDAAAVVSASAQGSGATWTEQLRAGLGGDSLLGSVARSAARTIGSQIGREIVRGVLGSILGGSLGGQQRRRR